MQKNNSLEKSCYLQNGQQFAFTEKIFYKSTTQEISTGSPAVVVKLRCDFFSSGVKNLYYDQVCSFKTKTLRTYCRYRCSWYIKIVHVCSILINFLLMNFTFKQKNKFFLNYDFSIDLKSKGEDVTTLRLACSPFRAPLCLF